MKGKLALITGSRPHASQHLLLQEREVEDDEECQCFVEDALTLVVDQAFGYDEDELDETWARRAACRQRQIAIGKDHYEQDRGKPYVGPYRIRLSGTSVHAPDPTERMPKRAFDAKLSRWRRQLRDEIEPWPEQALICLADLLPPPLAPDEDLTLCRADGSADQYHF